MGNPAIVVLERERWEQPPASTRFAIHQLINFANGFAGGLQIFAAYIEKGKIQAPPAILEVLRSMERSTAELQVMLLIFNSATAVLSEQRASSLAGAIGAVRRLHESILQQTGFVVDTDEAAESGVLVAVPFHILTLSLAHVISNAIDAMAASGKGNLVTISLRENGDVIECAIRDDGPGIDSNLGDAFQPGRTTKDGSDGLGLYLTRCSLLEHNTQIAITSTGPKGTEITLYLPKAKQEKDDG